MTKIAVKEIKDLDTKVPINSGFETIEHIKAEIARCNKKSGRCQVEVMEMWGSDQRS